jgi:hypothetical protein
MQSAQGTVNSTTPSTEPISYSTGTVSIHDMTRHSERACYRDPHFRGKITKEWSKKEYEAKIIEIKERLAPLQDARG